MTFKGIMGAISAALAGVSVVVYYNYRYCDYGAIVERFLSCMNPRAEDYTCRVKQTDQDIYRIIHLDIAPDDKEVQIIQMNKIETRQFDPPVFQIGDGEGKISAKLLCEAEFGEDAATPVGTVEDNEQQSRVMLEDSESGPNICFEFLCGEPNRKEPIINVYKIGSDIVHKINSDTTVRAPCQLINAAGSKLADKYCKDNHGKNTVSSKSSIKKMQEKFGDKLKYHIFKTGAPRVGNKKGHDSVNSVSQLTAERHKLASR